ncbi:MAG: rubrerythrin family protein [Desulfobulbaceae bacterium]|uniref:Rubrerythrin family protein n=1 Tax=Candidatus Desulfatifera sulfidica TaxID=2841691 RepID=A0A8J6TEE4_9BACT|nr:rubrerythrin family protein [Candidatus Desulfatifera sulfidica]
MHATLTQHLEKLFLKTSRGAARKAIYALRARQSGEPAVAALYEAMSQSEAAQARRLLIQLRGQTHTNEENLRTCFTEETPALINSYNAAALQAEQLGEQAMHNIFSQSERVERIFLSLEKKVARGQAADQATYHICRFCGFIREGAVAPEECPICTAPRSRFHTIGKSLRSP